jgi:endonuclease YncB( thermonuclease family)
MNLPAERTRTRSAPFPSSEDRCRIASMLRRALLVLGVLALAGAANAGDGRRVSAVIDGDTVTLTDGARVRLVQIDTPELGTSECYSRAAATALRRLAPAGSSVRLERDPALEAIDRYGRLLRYVWRGSTNVNVELVRQGAATVWLYEGARGRYATQLLAAARDARANGRGLWGACKTAWDPTGPATTSPRTRAGSVGSAGGRCDASYPGACIPPPPPDLDCGDVAPRRFRVLQPDPHRFDGDGDGVGCERD